MVVSPLWFGHLVQQHGPLVDLALHEEHFHEAGFQHRQPPLDLLLAHLAKDLFQLGLGLVQVVDGRLHVLGRRVALGPFQFLFGLLHGLAGRFHVFAGGIGPLLLVGGTGLRRLALGLALPFALPLAFALSLALALTLALSFALALALALALAFALAFAFALGVGLALAFVVALGVGLILSFGRLLAFRLGSFLGGLRGLHVVGELAGLCGNALLVAGGLFHVAAAVERSLDALLLLNEAGDELEVFANAFLLRGEAVRLVFALQELQEGLQVLLELRLVFQGAGKLIFLQQIDGAGELEVDFPLLALLDDLLQQGGAAGVGRGVHLAHVQQRFFQPLERLAHALLVAGEFFRRGRFGLGRGFAAAARRRRGAVALLLGAPRRRREQGNQPAQAKRGNKLSPHGHVYFSNNSRTRLFCRSLVCWMICSCCLIRLRSCSTIWL